MANYTYTLKQDGYELTIHPEIEEDAKGTVELSSGSRPWSSPNGTPIPVDIGRHNAGTITEIGASDTPFQLPPFGIGDGNPR